MFRHFAKASGLAIQMKSIRSRPVPEPDIRCTVGKNAVAFELGEIVGRSFAAATNERYRVRQRFRTEYDKLPQPKRHQIESALGGPPAILLGFDRNVPPGKWHHAIQPILEYLIQQGGSLAESEVKTWLVPALRAASIDQVKLLRATSRRASLHIAELTEVFDGTIELLEKKFAKRYETRAPIELLAYYASQAPFERPGWLGPIQDYITVYLGASRFRRVWLYNTFNKEILFVYPDAPTW